MPFRDHLRAALGVAAGAAAYVPLVLLPVAGPMLAGLACGWLSGAGARKGFILGVLSGVLGYLAWLGLIIPAPGPGSDIFFWVLYLAFLLWNGVGILLCGSFSALASSASLAGRYISDLKDRAEQAERTYETGSVTYVVCPDCGTANTDESAFCSGCGAALQEENAN